MFKKISTLLVISLIAGCQYINNNWIYKPDLPQGNLVTQEQVDELQVGMPVQEVLLILGSPMLPTPFQSNRLYYYYTYKPGKGAIDARSNLIITFDASYQVIDIDTSNYMDATPETDFPLPGEEDTTLDTDGLREAYDTAVDEGDIPADEFIVDPLQIPI